MATIAQRSQADANPPVIGDPPETIELFAGGRSAFDLRYIFAVLRANLLLIASILGLAIATALVVTLLDTPRYTAQSTVQIDSVADSVLGNESENDSATSYNIGYDIDRFLKTQTDILRSRGLAMRVAQRLKLYGNPRFLASQEIDPDAKRTPEQDRLLTVRLLQRNLTVNLPRDSRIATLSFESTDPQVSADLANAYAAEFIQSNLQRKFDSSSYARNFVAQQLADAKLRLEQSERAVNAYSRNAGLIRTAGALGSGTNKDGSTGSGSGSITTESLLQLNQALSDAKARRLVAEGEWQAMSGVPMLSSSQELTNTNVNQLLTQRGAVTAALQAERARHLEQHPAVRAKRQELEAVNAQLAASGAAVRNSVRAQYQAALQTERSIAAQVDQLKGQTLSEQDRAVQYALLARDADTNRQVYDGLLQRYKELNASAGVSLSNISIIDGAEAPTVPSSPNLFKNLLIALIIGTGLAAVTVFVKDQFDDSIRVPEDVEPKLALPLLGVVPKSRGDALDSDLDDPKSPVSEAYNSLRGLLLFSTSQGLPQVLLITSAQAGEGKSTTSRAIAIGLARLNKRVVIVDADLRRPSLHRYWSLPNETGLVTLLTSEQSPGTVLQKAEDNENLWVLTSGPVPTSPTELLLTGRLEQVVQDLAAEFDCVVIDSPPVLGLADSPTISALADGVVFVVEADRSRRGSLKASLRRLRAMRPIMLGAVLTKFDPLKGGNRYSEYYGYQYYQYGDTASAKGG